MTLVDAYYIPNERVEEYIKTREHFAKIAMDYYSKDSFRVSRDHAGSQDGEAVVGYDENDNAIHFMHLDPYCLEEMEIAEREGKLEEYLSKN